MRGYRVSWQEDVVAFIFVEAACVERVLAGLVRLAARIQGMTAEAFGTAAPALLPAIEAKERQVKFCQALNNAAGQAATFRLLEAHDLKRELGHALAE